MELENILIEIVNDSQDVTFNIQKGIENLRELFSKVALLEQKDRCNLILLRQFVKLLNILLIERNEHRVHFVVEFIIKFLVQFNQNENEEFIQYELINYLINNLKANSDTVRQRICQIFYRMLSSMGPEEKLDERIFLKLQLNLVERLRDSNKRTQILAIKAASFLQTPHNKYCPIINSFMDLLKKESLPQIRMLLVDSIAITNYVFNVFKHFLMYDTNTSVQSKVLAVLEKKAEKDLFDPEFRKQIINCLFKIQNFDLMEKYIQKWSLEESTRQYLDNFEIEEMYLNVTNDRMEFVDEKFEKLMGIYFSLYSAFRNIVDFNQSYKLSQDIFEDLELSIQLRFLLKHCLDTDQGSILTQHLAIDLKSFWEKLINNLGTADTQYRSLVLYNLIEANLSLNMLHLNVVEDTESLKILINAVGSKNEHNVILIKLVLDKINLNQLPQLVWKFYKDYVLLLNTDADLLKKFLWILTCFTSRLTGKDFNSMDPMNELNFEGYEQISEAELNIIEYLVQKVVLRNIAHLDPGIRVLAVKTLGLTCAISSQFAASYISLLLKVLVLDYPEVTKETQKALYNMILAYSRNIAQFDEDFGKTLKDVFDSLEAQLDLVGISDIKFIAYEGFAKLLVNKANIPNKPIILLKLLTAYFCETDDEMSDEELEFDAKLKSLLCSFFEAYASVDIENLTDLSQMALPMLKISIEEPQLGMRVRKVAKFFYYYCNGTKNRRQAIINLILNQVRINYNDYKRAVKWIEIMLEFNVHQSDINNDKVKFSVAILNEILDKLEGLIIKFKKEKWKLTSEANVRCLMDTVKRLIANNGGRLVKKRKLERIHELEEKEQSDSKKNKVVVEDSNEQ